MLLYRCILVLQFLFPIMLFGIYHWNSLTTVSLVVLILVSACQLFILLNSELLFGLFMRVRYVQEENWPQLLKVIIEKKRFHTPFSIKLFYAKHSLIDSFIVFNVGNTTYLYAKEDFFSGRDQLKIIHDLNTFTSSNELKSFYSLLIHGLAGYLFYSFCLSWTMNKIIGFINRLSFNNQANLNVLSSFLALLTFLPFITISNTLTQFYYRIKINQSKLQSHRDFGILSFILLLLQGPYKFGWRRLTNELFYRLLPVNMNLNKGKV